MEIKIFRKNVLSLQGIIVMTPLILLIVLMMGSGVALAASEVDLRSHGDRLEHIKSVREKEGNSKAVDASAMGIATLAVSSAGAMLRKRKRVFLLYGALAGMGAVRTSIKGFEANRQYALADTAEEKLINLFSDYLEIVAPRAMSYSDREDILVAIVEDGTNPIQAVIQAGYKVKAIPLDRGVAFERLPASAREQIRNEAKKIQAAE